MTNEETGSPALAQMIHQTDLFSWLVRTAGKVIAILFLTPLALGVLGAFLDPEGGGASAGAVLGTFIGVVALVVWLPSATAPYPSERVRALLDADDA